MAALGDAVKTVNGGVRVAVRLTPKGRRDAIEGLADTADGGAEVKASVTAVPEDGKANRALVKLLSKSWGVAKTDIAIVAGATDRHKVLSLTCDPERILPRIAQSIAAAS
jgi:hypothetical protein